MSELKGGRGVKGEWKGWRSDGEKVNLWCVSRVCACVHIVWVCILHTQVLACMYTCVCACVRVWCVGCVRVRVRVRVCVVYHWSAITDCLPTFSQSVCYALDSYVCWNTAGTRHMPACHMPA